MQKILLFFSLILFSVIGSLKAQPLWLRYPSISPDGQTIVFSYKGDIYKVPTTGGTATPLTIHEAYDYKPVWSPDGSQIAFASDRFGNFDIFTIPAEGGAAIRLTFFSKNEIPVSYTPDGKNILYNAQIQDSKESAQFPYGRFTELYKVSVADLNTRQILTTPAEGAQYNKDQSLLIYFDKKGYENYYRKHHQSSITRDIWKYETASGKYTQLTQFKGEDRQPVFSSDQNSIFYLSEESGSFNVFKLNLSEPTNITQISNFDKNPVRSLSVSNNDLLCYNYDGEIYTQKQGSEPQKVNIKINLDFNNTLSEWQKRSSGATEMALSPNGKEIAFILQGEVFVTSTEYATTKRITNTPEQERSVSFSPDGRTLLYASERDSSWNLYATSIVNKDEPYFSSSTLLKEETLLANENETFQPHYSPNGKEVAYLENRVTLKVLNLESQKQRTILDKKYNYSYSDGDQWYQWSPDGKWFLVNYSPYNWSINEVGLVKSDASNDSVVNLTHSGYSDNSPKWTMKGNAMLWFNDKMGMRSHGSWGSEYDAYVMFFNEKTFDRFNLSEEELKIKKEQEKEQKKTEEDDDAKKKKKKKTEELKTDENIDINLTNIEDRKKRLTINSSRLADALLSPDGDKLYYLSRFEKGYDLWLHDLKKNETKLVTKLNSRGGSMVADSTFENIYVFANGKITKIKTADNSSKPVAYNAEFYLDKTKERDAIFEHVWRQVKRKWYRPDLNGVDWDYYKKEYAKFLPHISNNYDFSELLSEMLGELNGSHTGARYRPQYSGDATARLGIFYDENYKGSGIKITEIIDKSPLSFDGSKIEEGDIIEKIDGKEIHNSQDQFIYLNHKKDKPTMLSIYNPNTKKRWEETVKPISISQENQLLYERWVKNRRADTEKLSDGRLGYVHVRGMNSSSFREVYSEVLGRYHDKEAIIIDTRFNGGGWLHDDLMTFFNGKKYLDFYPGGTYFGSEPSFKWHKPSILIVNEANYSDAHGFPFAYRANDVGKIVGMPVAGTMTAVWWERLQDPTLVFGIPQIGTKDMNGNYLENNELEPDKKVKNTYETISKGEDLQLEMSVKELLNELDKK